jgi:actin-related protein
LECEGIHKIAYNSIGKCDICIRKDFYNNIVLAGGSTLFDGFDERFIKELKVLENEIKINLLKTPDRKISSWIGASIIASLSTFEKISVSKDEYIEFGPSIINK